MIINYKSIFLCWFTLLFITSLTAQQNPVERSANNIQKLKDGVLVIRLTSKNNKIKELNRLLAHPEVTPKTKEGLQKKLHETVSEIKGFNTKVYYSFSEIYNFSEVLFMYDTASVSLKKKLQKGYFLDKNLNVDPSISLNNRNFCVLRYGSTDPKATSGVEAFVFMDDQLQDLTKPFPYYMKLRSWGQRFLSMFTSRSINQINIVNRVTKINQRLEKYYAKMIEQSNTAVE
ncbi:MAG: hypothetical protein AB8G15_00330 [Saprospiraceae bacterium]